MRFARGRLLPAALLGLLSAACSLAGDVTPPPVLATAQMARPLPTIVATGEVIPPDGPPDLTAGAAIYLDKCAACHGVGGLGDGELAANLEFPPAPLGDPSFARTARPQDWYSVVTLGRIDRLMPGFVSLSDQERWDVVGYALSLSSALEPVALADSSAPARVTGTVRTGTAAAVVPAGLQINLFGFDGEQEALRQTVAADRQGGYRFDEVEALPGRLFFTTVEYQGVIFRSELAHLPADADLLQLPLTIYETTSDAGALAVERLHVLIDFPAEDLIRVLELWVLANPSDRVIVSPLSIPLPPGAVNLTFEQGELGERFELTELGFLDREPIPPGSGIDQLAFAFDLPAAARFEQQVQQPVQAVTVLVPAEGARVSGLEDRGVQDLGGLPMRNYIGGPLDPGEVLSFRVSGAVGSSPALESTLIGAAALVGAGLLTVRWWTRGKPPRSSPPANSDQLIQAIARLDDEFERGEIAEAAYQSQRAALKARALSELRSNND